MMAEVANGIQSDHLWSSEQSQENSNKPALDSNEEK